MSRRKIKARDRITQKMTRDGLVERNETTGEVNSVSGREAELDLRGETPEGIADPRNAGKPVGTADKRKVYQKTYRQFQEQRKTPVTEDKPLKPDMPPTQAYDTAAGAEHDVPSQAAVPFSSRDDEQRQADNPRKILKGKGLE